MSADLRTRQSRLTMVQAAATQRRKSSSFVRLSQLRKLRDCEQVAAVCYRIRRDRDKDAVEFLLVQTRNGRWTFPKGNAEPGLTHAQAAALEAYEEAGVHGRIEEASFARFARNVGGKQAGSRKSATRSSAKELTINVHLCEVSRLTAPQEPNRNRTWFSLKDAKRNLREGREGNDGAAFARVVDKALARIQQQRSAADTFDDFPIHALPSNNRREVSSHIRAAHNDALQSVRLEAFEGIYSRMAEASMPYLRTAVRQPSVPIADAHPLEVLQAEILQFGPPREKRTKALGTGTRTR
ncbi:MAG TPA: NUDIX domain-containing protein [Candidatus Sulfotelmatobacter sp.]|nr:NUDIX domain-containing protein [Candidatus Sulfotelmatobacter sp.]